MQHSSEECDEAALLTPSLSAAVSSTNSPLDEETLWDTETAAFYNIGVPPLSPASLASAGQIVDFLSITPAYNDISPIEDNPVELPKTLLNLPTDTKRNRRKTSIMLSDKKSEDMNSVDILTELANFSAGESTVGSLSTPSSPNNLSQTFNTGNRNPTTASRSNAGYSKVAHLVVFVSILRCVFWKLWSYMLMGQAEMNKHSILTIGRFPCSIYCIQLSPAFWFTIARCTRPTILECLILQGKNNPDWIDYSVCGIT